VLCFSRMVMVGVFWEKGVVGVRELVGFGGEDCGCWKVCFPFSFFRGGKIQWRQGGPTAISRGEDNFREIQYQQRLPKKKVGPWQEKRGRTILKKARVSNPLNPPERKKFLFFP